MMWVRRCASAHHTATRVARVGISSGAVATTARHALTTVVAVVTNGAVATIVPRAPKAIAPMHSNALAPILARHAPKVTGHRCHPNVGAIRGIHQVAATNGVVATISLHGRKVTALICPQSAANLVLLRQHRAVTMRTRCRRCHPIVQQLVTTSAFGAGVAPMLLTRGVTKATTNELHQP